MKRGLMILFMALLCLTAAAGEMNLAGRMANKAVRGAVDLVTGIVELPMQTYKGYQKGFGMIKNEPASKTVGTILGFFRGIGHSAGRVTHGGRELFGFWTADQVSNEGIGVPFDAERSWEKGEQYSLLKPSLKEGLTPIGRKLTLGLANTFAGLAEIPVQIMDANKNESSLLTGTGKGVYYFISREIYGVSDVFTFFFMVPNQVDTYGYPYTSRYPWGDLGKK